MINEDLNLIINKITMCESDSNFTKFYIKIRDALCYYANHPQEVQEQILQAIVKHIKNYEFDQPLDPEVNFEDF